jgi:hypothetical protein
MARPTTYYTAFDADKVLGVSSVSLYLRRHAGTLKPDAKTFSGRHLYKKSTLMAVKGLVKKRKTRARP